MHDEPTMYCLELDMGIKTMVPAILVLFLSAGVFALLQTSNHTPGSLAFLTVWFGVIVFIGYQVLSLPLRIDHHANGTITFRSLLRSRTIRVSTILAIKPVTGQFGFFHLEHQKGKILFLNQFTGFHRLVSYLIAENPHIELRGC